MLPSRWTFRTRCVRGAPAPPRGARDSQSAAPHGCGWWAWLTPATPTKHTHANLHLTDKSPCRARRQGVSHTRNRMSCARWAFVLLAVAVCASTLPHAQAVESLTYSEWRRPCLPASMACRLVWGADARDPMHACAGNTPEGGKPAERKPLCRLLVPALGEPGKRPPLPAAGPCQGRARGLGFNPKPP